MSLDRSFTPRIVHPVFKVGFSWDVAVESGGIAPILDRADGLTRPCRPSKSRLADAVAAVLLAPHLEAGTRFPLDRCEVCEATEEMLANRGPAQYKPLADERLVALEFVVRVDGDEEPRMRTLALDRYGVPIGQNSDLLASAVDDEIALIENPATDGLDFSIPDYQFWIDE